MANFSPGEMHKSRRKKFAGKRFIFKTRGVRMPNFNIFRPGLKFECDYMRVFCQAKL